MADVVLREGSGDDPRLFALFARIVAAGEGFPQLPPLTRSAFEETWVRPVTAVVLAEAGDELAGAAYLKPNGPGLMAHVANAGYVLAPGYRGRGLGRRLVERTIELAPAVGFDAIQFNFVFASNPARPMYESLGFREVGRIPLAVRGEEDAVLYWRAVP